MYWYCGIYCELIASAPFETGVYVCYSVVINTEYQGTYLVPESQSCYDYRTSVRDSFIPGTSMSFFFFRDEFTRYEGFRNRVPGMHEARSDAGSSTKECWMLNVGFRAHRPARPPCPGRFLTRCRKGLFASVSIYIWCVRATYRGLLWHWQDAYLLLP